MKKMWVKIVIFLLLAVAGMLFAFMCLSEVNPSSLQSYHDSGVYTSFVDGPLLPGNDVRGEFTAGYDNLGMVKLRIRTFNRINTTHITFTLREKGSPDPIATNAYALDRFPDGLLYPFGFPVIAGSKGRTYEFTLESTDGAPDNAIGLVAGYHNVATQYVFNKSEILNGSRMGIFAVTKASSILSDPYSILYITMFLVPAFVFIFKRYGQIAIFYTLLIYTYIPLSMHSNTILVTAASVLGIALLARTAASRIYIAALLWLVQIPLLVALGNILSADRTATLIFFLLVVGAIMAIKEIKSAKGRLASG